MKNKNDQPLLGITILLVEDNELNILIASKFLNKWGAEIEVARNGIEAIKMFDEATHGLVLMDLNMPLMDGYDTTLKLRQQGVRVPIIALTASVFLEDSRKIIKNGISEVILKPFEPGVFLNTIVRSIELFKAQNIAY